MLCGGFGLLVLWRLSWGSHDSNALRGLQTRIVCEIAVPCEWPVRKLQVPSANTPLTYIRIQLRSMHQKGTSVSTGAHAPTATSIFIRTCDDGCNRLAKASRETTPPPPVPLPLALPVTRRRPPPEMGTPRGTQTTFPVPNMARRARAPRGCHAPGKASGRQDDAAAAPSRELGLGHGSYLHTLLRPLPKDDPFLFPAGSFVMYEDGVQR